VSQLDLGGGSAGGPEPSYLQGLNAPQKKAVEAIQGPLLILAGAGSGKTRVLTRRIAHMLDRGIPPWRILAVTFTNKAAGEMKERVAHLVGPERARKLTVSTFHSACVRILRQDIQALGYSNQFVIYDDDDQIRLLKAISKDQNLDPKRFPPRGLRGIIDRAKNKLLGPEGIAEDNDRRVVAVFEEYERRLQAASAVDFNDIINKVVELYEAFPAILEKWQNRYQYLLIDEYQDTNAAQYKLVRLLSARHRNLAVVGDDDQSIYSFRGADITNILSFERDFPDAVVVMLEQNYRSTSRILRAAMSVVQRNPGRKDKELWTEASEGKPLELIVGRDEDAEAAKVAERIRQGLRQGRQASDFAVIYRTNARSRVFEQAFRRAGIPHILVGTRRFYERREVKDILAYLKLALNPADEMGFLRVVNVPRRGIGPKTVELLRQLAQDQGSSLIEAARTRGQGKGKVNAALAAFVRLIDQLADALEHSLPGELVELAAKESGYLELLEAEDTDEARGRIENIQSLAADAASQEFTLDEGLDGSDRTVVLQAFLDRATLSGQADELPDEGGRVTLMTAHLAKGLEYPVVFVAGLVEGSFPLTRDPSERAIEEERRLTYVAFTRAQEELVLTRAMMRMQYGQGMQRCTPSRFLDEVPRELIRGYERAAPRARQPSVSSQQSRDRMKAFLDRHRVEKKPAVTADAGPRVTRTPSSPADFKVGVRVLHGELGEGVIRNVSGSRNEPRLTIEFSGMRRKTLFARYASLEIIES
jgi:DNA helicase-2/ATP-dependent DNA helicase PcrA